MTEEQEVLSRFHEAIVELVSQHPERALPFLSRLPLSFVSEGDRVTADNANLGTARPRELAADCLLRVVRNDKTVLVIVVEVQLAKDSRKKFTWPAYLVGARTRHRCNAILLVIAPHARVAAWARKPIALGPGAGFIHPQVMGPNEMPSIESEHDARKNPEFAVLSAITHGHDADVQRSAAIVIRTTKALFAMNHPHSTIYCDLMQAAHSEAARKAFEMNPQTYQYFDKKLRAAKAEAKAEGSAEGAVAATALAVIGVFEARGLKLTRSQRVRISNCRDLQTLRSWLAAAAVATKSVNQALSTSDT